MSNKHEAIKKFIIYYFAYDNLKNLSAYDWNNWFMVLELKYPEFLYSCTLYCILNEWSTYYQANKDNFTYLPDPAR